MPIARTANRRGASGCDDASASSRTVPPVVTRPRAVEVETSRRASSEERTRVRATTTTTTTTTDDRSHAATRATTATTRVRSFARASESLRSEGRGAFGVARWR
jgi:hypothetical protein